MKKLLVTALICTSFAVYASQPTENIAEMSQPDMEFFVNPYIIKELKLISGQTLLEAGSNAATWSIVAAQNGARSVYGIDLNRSLIEAAELSIAKAGVDRQVTLIESDLEKLPFETASFDHALSINNSCDLPPTTYFVTTDSFQVCGLGSHFKEIARVLKADGKLVAVAPASFGVVFTVADCDEISVMEHVNDVLQGIENCEDEKVVAQALNELKEVLRATFVTREDKLVLVTDEKMLQPGERVWRKLPEGAISTFYHSEEEYLVAIKDAGLACEEIKRPCFFGNVKYRTYKANSSDAEQVLGEAYIENHPFTIYYISKKA